MKHDLDFFLRLICKSAAQEYQFSKQTQISPSSIRHTLKSTIASVSVLQYATKALFRVTYTYRNQCESFRYSMYSVHSLIRYQWCDFLFPRYLAIITNSILFQISTFSFYTEVLNYYIAEN